jgi:hypothetical protein
MGNMLANADVHGYPPWDLLEREEQVALFLRRVGFDPRDIAVGLDEAIEVAREVLSDGSL